MAALQLPDYEPYIWNVTQVVLTNNCYNYANNIITNNYAQPGHRHGKNLRSLSIFTKYFFKRYARKVKEYAILDGLEPVTVAADQAVPLDVRNLVALVVRVKPDEDFHWYRLDSCYTFSHKPGQTNAKNVDDQNLRINDPRNCYQDYRFVTFMKTSTNVQISGPPEQ